MKNGKYLDSLSSDKKSKILKNIASHYGISVADAEDEVRDDDAEMLYEYIANDKSLRMEVYNDMERGKMAKGGKMATIKKKYEQNEDDNYHSENVILLAKNFGDANDLKEAKRILALHNKEGHLSTENGKKRQELHLKLIAKARKEMAKENVSFAKGGKTKGKKEPMVVRSYFEDEAIDYAKGGKTMKAKLVDDDYASRYATQEKEIGRVRLQFSKNQPKNEFQKDIQTRIEQNLLGLAIDGVFAGLRDSKLDLVIRSLFYQFRKIGEDGIYYASNKIENYSKDVIKERNTTFQKGGSILSSNYSIGGL